MRRIPIKGTKTVVIGTDANGQSAEIDLHGFELQGIIMPAGWDAANLTVLASDQTGGTFDSVYDSDGTELTLSVAASRAIGLTQAKAAIISAFRFIKLRSGTSGAVVVQSATRSLILVFKSK